MNKNFSYYLIMWFFVLAITTVSCFVIAAGTFGLTPSFIAIYACTCVSLVAQLACSCFVFRAKTLQKMFYRLSVYQVSVAFLMSVFVLDMAFFLLRPLPWISIVCFFLLTAGYAIVTVKICAAGKIVEDIDVKVEEDTSFMKQLTVKAKYLLDSAKDETIRKECNKVYEAIRYADPVSSSKYAHTEVELENKVSDLAEAVKVGDADKVSELSEAIVLKVKEFNDIRKISK